MLEIEKLNRKIAVAKKHAVLREIALEEYRTNAIATRLGLSSIGTNTQGRDSSGATSSDGTSSRGSRYSQSLSSIGSQNFYGSHDSGAQHISKLRSSRRKLDGVNSVVSSSYEISSSALSSSLMASNEQFSTYTGRSKKKASPVTRKKATPVT